MPELIYLGIGFLLGLLIGTGISFGGAMATIARLRASVKQQSKTIDELSAENYEHKEALKSEAALRTELDKLSKKD